ncbi:hypothetical protein B0O99DRAFT_80422 [Bisporella sp. PMI_857]|nr:hypothetical protein B0O99DRAFT_80422 [Bisporella sp. PMI_857]
METAKLSRPRPGRVMALCKELGWDREEKRTKRNRRSFLAKATLKFRAEFCPIEGRFPLDHTDPIAQECAKQFCALDERNPHVEDRFFDKTPEAIEQGLPSLPDDRELIIDRLAQLFCVQEYSSRKYKLRQREHLHNDEDEYVDEMEDTATSQCLSPYTTHIFRLDNDWTNHTRLSTTDCVAPAHIETPGIILPGNESSDTYRVLDQSSLGLNSIVVDFSSKTTARRNRQTRPETRSFSDKINQGQGSGITMPPRTNGAEHNYTPSEYNSQGRPNIEVAALGMQNSIKTKQPSLR